ncbi:MAG: CDGSH iron-sulfur domain-containing protein [Magnetococcales bacterium]|nr:CDGSH iron-sulfur domain-containing protein [Magnetococcales bacterium]
MFTMHPVITTLPAGEHLICGCGESGRAPLCDRRRGELCRLAKPLTLEREKTVPLCGCGQSGKPPLCDGTHGYSREKEVHPRKKTPPSRGGRG